MENWTRARHEAANVNVESILSTLHSELYFTDADTMECVANATAIRFALFEKSIDQEVWVCEGGNDKKAPNEFVKDYASVHVAQLALVLLLSHRTMAGVNSFTSSQIEIL